MASVKESIAGRHHGGSVGDELGAVAGEQVQVSLAGDVKAVALYAGK